MIVCEEGTLLLQAGGGMTVFRKGKVVENESMPEVAPRHHWEDWADNCLGDKKPLWTPFQIGCITEPALLAVKASLSRSGTSGMPQNIVLPIMMRPRGNPQTLYIRKLRLLDSVERQASWFLCTAPRLRGVFFLRHAKFRFELTRMYPSGKFLLF